MIVEFQGPTPKHVTNLDRAGYAADAMHTFVTTTGGSGDMRADIRDLIANLLHLARAMGFDPRAEVEGAIGMWSAEDREPDPVGIDAVTVTIYEAVQ